MSQAKVQQARAALQADPTRAQVWLDYIAALIDDEQLEEARRTSTLALQKGLTLDRLEQLQARITPVALNHRPVATSAGSDAPSRHAAHTLNSQATRLRAQGRLQEAQKLFRKALAFDPRFVAAHYNLANTLKESGEFEQAERSYRQALAHDPLLFEAHFNLANLLRENAQAQRAVEHYRAALRVRPQFAPAHWNLGMALDEAGKTEEAEASYRRAVEVEPGSAAALVRLGQIQYKRKNPADALASFRRALALDGVDAQTHRLCGLALFDMHRFKESEQSFQEALALDPNDAVTHYNLALTLTRLARDEQAEVHYRRAVSIDPQMVQAHVNLGDLLKFADRTPEAEASFRTAIELQAGRSDICIKLGTALEELFRHEEAERYCRQAVIADPQSTRAHASLVFNLNYQPDKPAEDIYAAYTVYEQHFGVPLRAQWQPHANAPMTLAGGPTRRLRIGYVSPDLRQHSVRHFLEPLLASHDRSRFEVFAYAELASEDATSARYRMYCDHFILTRGMSDEALASRIRSDAIDVLVDLAGHTAGNRLLVFARKPAPVSLSWLGSGYTTGLTAIDYLLTDEASAPAGSEHLFSEAPWRLPCVYAYRPDAGMGEVSSLPALTSGRVTFGTLTRAIRINHRTIRVWAQVLKRVPGSVLVIDSKNFQHASMQEAMAERFAQHGIAPQQLQIGCHSPPWDTLRAIDIGLDCFPHNSGTTLFETLFMGVPFVTLAGRPSVGRLGRSILTGLGREDWLRQWCADSEEDYIDKAVALASDLEALQRIRAELRPTMQRSALMDEASFARKVETAYAEMFARWMEAEMPEHPHQASELPP